MKNQFSEAAAKFMVEAQVEPAQNVSSIKKDILEKKWTSVVRLKKQVMELEKTVKQLKEGGGICERCE